MAKQEQTRPQARRTQQDEYMGPEHNVIPRVEVEDPSETLERIDTVLGAVALSTEVQAA
jgi:hypothetical protein